MCAQLTPSLDTKLKIAWEYLVAIIFNQLHGIAPFTTTFQPAYEHLLVGVVSYWRVVCSYLALQDWFLSITQSGKNITLAQALACPQNSDFPQHPVPKHVRANDNFQTEKSRSAL